MDKIDLVSGTALTPIILIGIESSNLSGKRHSCMYTMSRIKVTLLIAIRKEVLITLSIFYQILWILLS